MAGPGGGGKGAPHGPGGAHREYIRGEESVNDDVGRDENPRSHELQGKVQKEETIPEEAKKEGTSPREIRESGATPREEEYGGGLAHERGGLYVVGSRPVPRA